MYEVKNEADDYTEVEYAEVSTTEDGEVIEETRETEG